MGVHFLGEWYGCGSPRAMLADAAHLQRLCLCAARKAGLSIVGHLFHQCVPQGVIGTLLLAESHLAIHTWPEERCATVAAFIGLNASHRRAKARALYAYLRDGLLPDKENYLQVAGGGLSDMLALPR